MKEKNIKTIGKWVFTAAAALVTVISAIEGNVIGIIWPIISVVLNWAVYEFLELCDDLIKVNDQASELIDEIVTANHDLAEALKQKDAEITALQEEINKLKR